MPFNKRKRDLLDFDPNKSDPEDENFEPDADQPRPPRKKPRRGKSAKAPGRSRRPNRYGGSDVEDDDEVSEDESFGDDDDDDEEEEEEEDEDDAPINEATGRRRRKAARKRPSYRESSEDDVDIVNDSDDKDELVGETPKKKNTPKQTKIVVLNIPRSMRKATAALPTAAPATMGMRRSTRARTAEADEQLLELSNSGKHVVSARGSKSVSPEAAAAARNTRSTRGGKAPAPIPTIDEATQESSAPENGAEDDALPDVVGDVAEEPNKDEGNEVEVGDADEDQPMETVEEEADDEDDPPVNRRTRARAGQSGPATGGSVEPEPNDGPRRLTRKSRMRAKSLKEPSSDFDPDSGDDMESHSGKAKSKDAEDDEFSSPNPRGRKAAKGKGRLLKTSRQPEESGDEDELDKDELANELEELRQSSRSRRPRRRPTTPIEYEEVISKRRVRKPVDYAIKPLDQLMIEPDEEQDAAPTPARRRGRAGGASAWDRSLHTIAGPFGGVSGSGPGALFGGPWGTGAAGGVDSDSSDDEMGHRSGVGGNVGMTPTSAAPPGMLGGIGQAIPLEGLGGLGAVAPNVGKVKNPKAYADADPLGVDMNVDFSKVGGLEGHIDNLKEMVQLPLLYPELFMKFHVTPPRGVLFHGPPGTGKTLLARALANSAGIGGKKITFYMRKGADALSKWVGEAEKQLRLLFEEARRTQPSIIFFDEIDGLAPVRSSKQEQIHASIVSTLLALMDGMDGRGQVIVIGATNRPDNIDPALRRPGRFDREFYFPLPDIDGRQAIIDIHTKDWGLSEKFKNSLARDAKGFGGADLRALCTEAAMNAIQRTYPQIYSSKEKLIVDPDKISIHMADFSLSKKKIIPSSERSSTSGAAPLPKSIEPLLRTSFKSITSILDDILPRKKKVTALEEAMFEPYDDEDFGFGREALHEEFERSRVFRPRLLICGLPGMGHTYIGAAILHYLEGVHVQNFDLPTILGDQRSVEQVLVGLFTEVKRQKPSVIFIPNVDTWYSTLEGPALTAFLALLRSIKPTDPIMVLATAETKADKISMELKRDLFGFSSKNSTEIFHPCREHRREYFSMIIDHIRRSPRDFPDPAHRKKRILEELPVAPPPPPKVLTKAEEKAEWLRYRHLLNLMKVHLQPIMDQINRKYKKFRSPVIPHSNYQYLFDEQDPNHVRPDVENAVPRPYEIAKDKDGTQGLRETSSGKFYYNLDIQTIEERLANGYYIKPQGFLSDVKSLLSDAKAIGDRERYIKASELLTNVEVDVNDVDKKFDTLGVNWDDMYRAETRRRAVKAEKARKKAALQSVVDLVISDVGGAEVGSGDANLEENQHPRRLHTTTATFQVMSPHSNGNGESSMSQHHITNSTSVPSGGLGEDIDMRDFSAQHQDHTSPMQPPAQWPRMEPRALDISTRATAGGMTQISQVSAMQSLPPGVSPSAFVNDASTTKTSDPSNRSSNNFSTQATNGVHHEQYSQVEHIPDTQPLPGEISQRTSSDEQWPHSQVGLGRGSLLGFSQDSRLNTSPTAARSSHAPSMANLLNDPSPEEQSQSQRHSGGSSGSQQVVMDDSSGLFFLDELASRTSGCTIEQLEQINRELMAEIWRTKAEHNRMKVLDAAMRVFNEVIRDIEEMQTVLRPSQ
ncbi:uncharacterized protein BCR38DRAFT_481258 [Pseudomassariella vexata]|uniref:AAA+ ATPase domain-containing protein n=1 Tax=Pseudomassariella vexata TaxID=1141098 RepID=A0A1Y2EFM9_9PEZI|nr:uncharacterized protein BCR38DRAFT_481258 [Pseudomassariella vexata]ORY70114.1 hypothetical protein BCR38DRAFT_481258 [Pseudomassariella vexata]